MGRSWARIARETPSAVLLPLRGLLAYAAMSLVCVFRLGYQGSETSGQRKFKASEFGDT